MSTLFGKRESVDKQSGGLLWQATGGVLFLDEITELAAEAQAMLVRAVEKGRFLPVDSDREVESSFRLITGTTRDLRKAVGEGSFRADLWSRISLWTLELPALRERPEDLEMSLDDELSRFAETRGERVAMNREARRAFLDFARSPSSSWLGNFRDFSAACERMAMLAEGGQITLQAVRDEIERLRESWKRPHPGGRSEILRRYLAEKDAAALDLFERVQLQEVLHVCSTARSLSDAGRTLFSESRKARSSKNDADRVRKYLAKYDLGWDDFV
jgi:transcriptional regulatory protein RtcR